MRLREARSLAGAETISTAREIVMKRKWILGAALMVTLVQMPGSVQAFECPAHFAVAQSAIDKAADSIGRMEGGMPMAAHAHLRHARMSLVEANFHHGQAGDVHHARAIVRANEARGHAVTAGIMSRELTKR